MFTQTHLNLQSVCLHPRGEWRCQGRGLFFIIVRDGTGACISGAVSRRISSGDILVQDGTAGCKLSAADNCLVIACFSVGLEQLVPLFVINEIARLRSLPGAFKTLKLYRAGSALARKCHQLLKTIPPQFNLDHRSQLLRVAAVALATEVASARTGPAENEGNTSGILENVSAAELLNSPVGGLARKYGCSRRHLNRLFHQRFGVSAAALKMEMRLLKATSLLQNPDTKIIRVAEECGFNQLGIFNIRFKKRFGSSPGQWRKMVIQVQNQTSDSNSGNMNCQLRTGGLCPFAPKDSPSTSAGHGRKLPNKESGVLVAAPTLLLCGVTTLNSTKAAPGISASTEAPRRGSA